MSLPIMSGCDDCCIAAGYTVYGSTVFVGEWPRLWAQTYIDSPDSDRGGDYWYPTPDTRYLKSVTYKSWHVDDEGDGPTDAWRQDEIEYDPRFGDVKHIKINGGYSHFGGCADAGDGLVYEWSIDDDGTEHETDNTASYPCIGNSALVDTPFGATLIGTETDTFAEYEWVPSAAERWYSSITLSLGNTREDVAALASAMVGSFVNNTRIYLRDASTCALGEQIWLGVGEDPGASPKRRVAGLQVGYKRGCLDNFVVLEESLACDISGLFWHGGYDAKQVGSGCGNWFYSMGPLSSCETSIARKGAYFSGGSSIYTIDGVWNNAWDVVTSRACGSELGVGTTEYFPVPDYADIGDFSELDLGTCALGCP